MILFHRGAAVTASLLVLDFLGVITTSKSVSAFVIPTTTRSVSLVAQSSSSQKSHYRTIVTPTSAGSIHSSIRMGNTDHISDGERDISKLYDSKNLQRSSPSSSSAIKTTTQPVPIVLSSVWNNNSMKMGLPTFMAIMTIVTTTGIGLPNPADAAMSGGRMGGSFSSSRSYSGGSRGGGMRLPSSSRSYYNGGGGGGYYGGGPRTTIVAPIISPFYNPIVPFYGGGFGGYGGGVGAISYARGPGIFDLLFLGGLGFVVISALSNTISGATTSSSQWDDRDSTSGSTNLFGMSTSAQTTVLKCSVALEVSNRDDPNSILSVLDRMAKVTAKTDTRKGVVTLTKQVALELLRRKSSIYSASGIVEQFNNNNNNSAQRTFNQWSVQERSKFEQENVNKFGKFDLSSVGRNRNTDADDTSRALTPSKATMAVVTLVVSASGLNLNNNKQKKTIQSLSDLESILQSIASMSSNDMDDALNGAEILWTPEDRSETLTKQNVIADYPELNTL